LRRKRGRGEGAQRGERGYQPLVGGSTSPELVVLAGSRAAAAADVALPTDGASPPLVALIADLPLPMVDFQWGMGPRVVALSPEPSFPQTSCLAAVHVAE
jgi:hypothetical protein